MKAYILPAFYKATALTIFGVFLFTCVDIFIKLLSPAFHVGQVLVVFGAGTAFIFWLMAFFLGNTPQLLDDDLVYQRAITERLKIITAASGRVNVQISVLTRHLDHHQIDRP